MPNRYIIAGCNGAGKTTASYTVLPEMLNCREFVNADNIAAGLSPFNPESVAIEAGRIMLNRIDVLLSGKEDFAVETTLATRSYVGLIKKARSLAIKLNWFIFGYGRRKKPNSGMLQGCAMVGTTFRMMLWNGAIMPGFTI